MKTQGAQRMKESSPPLGFLFVALAAALLAAGRASAAETLSSVSPEDGAESFGNPGCGYAGGGWSVLPGPGGAVSESNLCGSSPNCTKLWSLQKYSKGYMYCVNGVAQTEHYAHVTNYTGGADIPLSENALLSISNSLAACRRNGGTCIPRFAYTWDGWGGAEPDDFSVMLAHIRQIGRVVSQFRDVVPAVECGMIGAYGEMHTSRYTDPAYQNRVVGAWLDALPDDMALLVRSPPVWMRYLGTTTQAFLGGGMDSTDATLLGRMGFYNDGDLGTDYDYGTWGAGGGSTTWSRSEARVFLRRQAVPYGGEFAGVSETYFDGNVHLLDPARHNIVAEWYDTHLSYLRTIRSSDMTICRRLAEAAFDSAAWAFDGMPDLHEYEGIDLRKFCEDHMGFRFVARRVEYAGSANSATILLTVENTGFGQLLFDDAPEVVLAAADGGAAFCVPVRGVSFRGIRGGETRTVEIPFAYPEGMTPGDWEVALRVGAPLRGESGGVPRRVVRFANAGGYDAAAKANRLCTVRLESAVDLAPDGLWFAHSAASGMSAGGRWGDVFEADGFTVRSFAIDKPKPLRSRATIELDMAANPLQYIPEPDGGAASFVFLAEGSSPVPFGYTREGWLRLGGAGVEEGAAVRLQIVLSPGSVEYRLNGAPLTDGSGRSVFPAAAAMGAEPELSFAGGSPEGVGFAATLRETGPEAFAIRLR